VVGGGAGGELWGVVKVAAAEGTVVGRWAHGALAISFFLFYKIFFTESNIDLSANIHREGGP
jgi:hypothetical protein